MEELFNKVLQVTVRTRDCDERKSNIRVNIELQQTTGPVHRRDLIVKLTDDVEPYFLFNLSISEEDFQSLKVQQGLLIDFGSFPQKFIDLLNLCYSEQDSENPRFLLHLSCPSAVLEGHASFSVVETNTFKHLNHLSLRLVQASDKEVKDHLAVCLCSLKAEKQSLELKLKKTEEDLTRQLNYAQQPLPGTLKWIMVGPSSRTKICPAGESRESPQASTSESRQRSRRFPTLSEKSKELDKLRSEWTSQTSLLSSRHSQELQSDREKAVEQQNRLQQQSEQLRQELETAHKRSSQQLQSRLTELEASCKELTEKKYKNESVIRDLKVKLMGAEEEGQRAKQQVLSLRRENSTLDTEVHDKERLLSQLQTRKAVLEQEVKDKEQLMRRTKEVLEATQQHKESVEENAETKEVQIKKLEATVKSLSEDLIKANGIIKKLQGELRGLSEKNKVKNTVIVSQEKVLQDTSDKLEHVGKDLHSSQQQLINKDEQIIKLKEQLETTVQKLHESKEVLKTNENVISWLNKQLNEKQLARKPPESVEPPSVSPTTIGLRAHFYPHIGKPPWSAATVTDAPIENRGMQPATRRSGDPAGLDSKYFERSDESIPVNSLSSSKPHRALEEEFTRKHREQEVFKMSGDSKCLNSTTQSRVNRFYPNQTCRTLDHNLMCVRATKLTSVKHGGFLRPFRLLDLHYNIRRKKTVQ